MTPCGRPLMPLAWRGSFRFILVVALGGGVEMKRFSAPAPLAPFLAPAPATFAAHGGPSPGAPGLTPPDRLFPTLGNGGYDVQHYELELTYGSRFTDPVNGTVTILARATQALSRFNLDFSGQSVGGVKVNGDRAAFKRADDE